MVYPGLMSPKLNKSEEKAPKVSFMLAPNLQSPYSVVGCANAAAVDASTLFQDVPCVDRHPCLVHDAVLGK